MITFQTTNDTIRWEHSYSISKARMHNPRLGSVTLPFTQNEIGPIPQDTPEGIYTLKVDTDCGCFSATVRVHLCHPPKVATTHTHTFPDADKVPPECCP